MARVPRVRDEQAPKDEPAKPEPKTQPRTYHVFTAEAGGRLVDDRWSAVGSYEATSAEAAIDQAVLAKDPDGTGPEVTWSAVAASAWHVVVVTPKRTVKRERRKLSSDAPAPAVPSEG